MSDPQLSEHYPEALLDIADAIEEGLIEHGIPTEKAREKALAIADRVRERFGGENLYLPKGVTLTIAARDREIFRKFNGANQVQLAREYDLTVRQIYSIVARVRDEEFKKRQMGLWDT